MMIAESFLEFMLQRSPSDKGKKRFPATERETSSQEENSETLFLPHAGKNQSTGK
jgi:hypothetical protein